LQQDSWPQGWLDAFHAVSDVAPVRNYTYVSARDSCGDDWICSVNLCLTFSILPTPIMMNGALIEPGKLLNRNLFFIKDAVKTLEAKTSDKFDVYDPGSRELLLECRELDLSGLTRLRRLAGGKYDAGSPFNLVARIPGSNQQILRIARKVPLISFKKPPIEFYNHEDLGVLTMRRKFFSLGRKFQFFTPQNAPLFELHAKSTFYGFRLIANKRDLATIWLRWKGDQADYFKQGFKYALSINEEIPKDSISRQLLLAFALSFHRIQI